MVHRTVEIWLVRHGETTWNEQGRLAGWSDVSLTSRGIAQAKALKPTLDKQKFDTVWSSDLERCVNTARHAFGEPVQDKRLREMHFGKLEGEMWQGIDEASRAEMSRFRGFSFDEGENSEIFEKRILDFVEKLDPGRHLVFTHGGVIRILTRDLGLDTFVPNGALVAVDWTAREILFVDKNNA